MCLHYLAISRHGPHFELVVRVQEYRRIFSLDAKVVQPGQRGTTRMHRHRNSTHTRSATETQQNSQPETPNGSWPLLLPRRRHCRRCCCCCCAAAVLLLCCCCFTTRDASRSTTRHNRLLFLVLCFLERTQERVTAQQQQQQQQQ